MIKQASLFRPADRKLIQSFEDLVDAISGSTPVDITESKADKAKRIKFLLSDYEAFCNYYFPAYCYAPFSKFHKTIQSEVIEDPNNIFLGQWARGFAKSTHLGLFTPCFLKFNGKLRGMMAGSYNETMAGEKLEDLRANLQGNERILNDFGEQQSVGQWEYGMFKTKDDIGFYGFGKRQSPRGTKFRWKRPNYGFVDDLNDARELKNDDIAAEDKRWVIEELKAALWTREWWLVIAQNKFHDNTVTALIENDDQIKAKVHRVDILDANGNSNWSENEDFSTERVKELEASEGGGFIRERMNTPYEEGKTFKAEWLNSWVDCDTIEYDGVLIHYLDPSYLDSDKSDYKAWVLIGKTGMHYDIIDCWIRKETSKAMWEQAYDIDNIYDEAVIQHCMEANFIQEKVHKAELERVEKDNGRALKLLYDHRKKGGKFERIATMQSLFQRGLIRFNIHRKKNEDMKMLRKQLLAIEKGSRINDDGPDALEGAIWMADRHTKQRAKATRSGKYRKKTKRTI